MFNQITTVGGAIILLERPTRDSFNLDYNLFIYLFTTKPIITIFFTTIMVYIHLNRFVLLLITFLKFVRTLSINLLLWQSYQVKKLLDHSIN